MPPSSGRREDRPPGRSGRRRPATPMVRATQTHQHPARDPPRAPQHEDSPPARPIDNLGSFRDDNGSSHFTLQSAALWSGTDGATGNLEISRATTPTSAV